VVLTAGHGDAPQAQTALEELCRTYWYPIYAYIRREGYSPHDAQDLTQEFFARLLEAGDLTTVGQEKGKFRSFLLAALNHFLSHEREHAQAAKRGGRATFMSFDDGAAEARYAIELATELTPERAFERRWAATLLEQAFARVRREFVAAGKAQLFEHLQSFLAADTEAGEYEAVAGKVQMRPGAVAVAVHRLRQRYRAAVRAEIAHTVASPDQIEDEMHSLFAALAPP
jgi:RNA polymerase sigma-70 factor (ECF subfamily)